MVAFQSGEAPIRSGKVVVQTGAGPCPGMLTVTNQALVFEPDGTPPPAGEGWGAPTNPDGTVSREHRIGLWRVRDARANGPTLQVDLLARVLVFRTDDIPGWVAAITEARVHAPPRPPEAEARRAQRKGLPPPSLRCTYCGNLSPPGSVKCVSCGAPF
jgi:hypothetical protein